MVEFGTYFVRHEDEYARQLWTLINNQVLIYSN